MISTDEIQRATARPLVGLRRSFASLKRLLAIVHVHTHHRLMASLYSVNSAARILEVLFNTLFQPNTCICSERAWHASRLN